VNTSHGLEKFSHLEDKIYRTIEQIKRERQERSMLERELVNLRHEVDRINVERDQLKSQVERLLDERDSIKFKVEAMLDAISALEPEFAEAAKK
jgi:predicted  nucleic acid-binding Zn-ribbon protein